MLTDEQEEQLETLDKKLALINRNIEESSDKHVIFLKTEQKKGIEARIKALRPQPPAELGNPS